MKRKFSQEEVEQFVHNNEVDIKHGETDGTLRFNWSIVKLDNKFFRLKWREELDDNWPDEYEEQEADEVKQVEKTVVIKVWVPISENKNSII